MKRITILPLVLLFLSVGAVKSQAPLSLATVADLQKIIAGNKALIDTQTKTLQLLDKLDQNAQQLKSFGKRG